MTEEQIKEMPKRDKRMEKTKVTVKMEIEVEDIEDFSKFITTIEKRCY